MSKDSYLPAQVMVSLGNKLLASNDLSTASEVKQQNISIQHQSIIPNSKYNISTKATII